LFDTQHPLGKNMYTAANFSLRNWDRSTAACTERVLDSGRGRASLTLDERDPLDEAGKAQECAQMKETAMHFIPDANKKIRELNQEIHKEQDPQRFMELVRELNGLLDSDGRTGNETARPPATSPKPEPPMGGETPRR
jgi:hypothetical protein